MDYKLIFENKNFRWIFISQTLSQVTIQVLNFLFLFKIFEETNSTIATSLLWIFFALPSLVIGPIAAVYVDTVDRKKILMVTNFAQSATILVYSLIQAKSIFFVYSTVFIYSLLNQFYVPAEQAAMVQVTKKEKLMKANSLFFLSQQGAIVFGLFSAAIMRQFISFSNSLFICSFLLVVAFASVAQLKALKTNEKKPKGFENMITDIFNKIIEWYRFVRGRKYIYYSMVLQSILNISLTIFVINIPPIYDQIIQFKGELPKIALIMMTMMGAITSAVLIPKSVLKLKRKYPVIKRNFNLLTLSTFVIAVFLPVFVNDQIRYIFASATFFILGYSFVGTIIPIQTFIQENTPNELRGRVFGNYWFIITFLTLFPVIFSGVIGDIVGVRILFFIVFLIFIYVAIRLDKNKLLSK